LLSVIRYVCKTICWTSTIESSNVDDVMKMLDCGLLLNWTCIRIWYELADYFLSLHGLIYMYSSFTEELSFYYHWSCWLEPLTGRMCRNVHSNQIPFCSCTILCFLPLVLWSCRLGSRKAIWPLKNWELWGTGMVVCLERVADLHMAQLMPLPLTVSCFSKIQISLPFWYRLTWVVPEKGPLNVCVCDIMFFVFICRIGQLCKD